VLRAPPLLGRGVSLFAGASDDRAVWPEGFEIFGSEGVSVGCVQDARLGLLVGVSSGADRHYCRNGQCGFAVTLVGDFCVYRRVCGWCLGPLGAMYDPMYFAGGIAMHGPRTYRPNPPLMAVCASRCSPLPSSTGSVRIGEPVLVRRPLR
jgi:hypothetical protein